VCESASAAAGSATRRQAMTGIWSFMMFTA
jgi:hypothetical protein